MCGRNELHLSSPAAVWGVFREGLSDDPKVKLVVALSEWSESKSIALWAVFVPGETCMSG